jgi:hypothetical protein
MHKRVFVILSHRPHSLSVKQTVADLRARR